LEIWACPKKIVYRRKQLSFLHFTIEAA